MKNKKFGVSVAEAQDRDWDQKERESARSEVFLCGRREAGLQIARCILVTTFQSSKTDLSK